MKLLSIVNIILPLLILSASVSSILAGEKNGDGEREQELILRRCIAQEETFLVTNKSPRYAARVILTQQLMNDVLINNIDFPIKKAFLKKICAFDEDNNPVDSSLLTIQYFMILKEKVLDLESLSPSEAIRVTAFFKEALQSLPQIFLNYVTTLIGHAPTYYCLQKRIPELDNFLYKYKYLESEASPENDLLNLETLKPIFSKLALYRQHYDKCSEELQQLEKENQKNRKEKEIKSGDQGVKH